MASPDPSVVTDQPSASRNRLVLIVYTAAIFVSALLLFSVQPLFTKMVLPRLGGSPAVWSVAMVFFQSLLLAGYAYAHYLTQIRNRWLPAAIHLVLLVIALLSLPLSIASGWGEPPTSGYAFWLLGLFAVSIGLPFFALAANNPLLQAWFFRTGHPDGPDPYFLYASSNIGSFLALLSYPVLLEPMFTLRTQNLIWTGGYGLLIVLIAACAVLLLRSPAIGRGRYGRPKTADAPPPPWILRARWIFLAAVPSGLLIAVTAHISTDVAAAPLLWVLPLSLYLLTWVLVFQSRPLLPHKWMLLAAAAGDHGRDRAARGRRRAEPAADARRPSALFLRHRDGLPWRTGAHPPGGEISHRLLCRAVVRRHGRRPVRRLDRAVRVFMGRGIPDPAGAGGAVPPARRRGAVFALERLVLAVPRRARGGPDRAVLVRRQGHALARRQQGLDDRRGRRALGLARARPERQPLEDLRHRRGGAGADPGLSGRRRAGGNRAQLLRRPQDRGDAARPVSRADARHDHPRRAEIPERRRHAGHRPARADHLLPQGRRHRAGDHGGARAQGRAAARRGDRARRGHADLRLRARRDLEVLRDRSDHGRYRARSQIFHLHPEIASRT